MEFQTFCKKGEDSEIYNYHKEFAKKFITHLGVNEENLRYHDHGQEQLVRGIVNKCKK